MHNKLFLKTVSLTSSLFLLSISLTGCSLFPKEQITLAPELITPPKITYKTVKAEKKNIIDYAQVVGTLVPSKTRDYCFKGRSGYLKTINFQAGDNIKKGDVLAELDTDQITSQIKIAELELESSELTSKDVNNNPNASESDKRKAELNVKKSQIQLASLKDELSKHKLVAETSGKIVFAEKVQQGQSISSGRTIFSVASPEDMVIEYTGANSEKFKVGMKVNLKAKDQDFKGTVVIDTSTSPKGQVPQGTQDPTKKDNGYISVKPDALIKDVSFGDSVTIGVERARKDNVIVLPLSSIRLVEGVEPIKYYVQVLEAGTKFEKYVEFGLSSGSDIEILQGVDEGDEIVIN
jgi:multidrug efflux pump subunit AcrA (membrane-fusion protein)